MDFVPIGLNQHYPNVGLDNGLARTRPQAIIWAIGG